MAAFFAEYGLFLLKAITIVIAIGAIIAIAAAAGRKASHEGLEVENLNKKYRKIADTLRNAVLSKDEQKKASKDQKKRDKAEAKETSTRPRSYIIDFKGDMHPQIVAKMKAAYDEWWKATRPLMVNEAAPMSPIKPFHELYNAQLKSPEGVPDWSPPPL